MQQILRSRIHQAINEALTSVLVIDKHLEMVMINRFDHALQELINWLDGINVPSHPPYWCKFGEVCQKYLLNSEASIKLSAQFSEYVEARKLTGEFTSYFDEGKVPHNSPF